MFLLYINYGIAMLFLIGIWFFQEAIRKTIGFKGLMMYFKAYQGRKKGVILVRRYGSEGQVCYNLGHKKSETIYVEVPKGEKEMSFVLDSSYVYSNEMGLRCVDVFDSDIILRSWKSSKIQAMNPYVFDKVMVDSIKSEQRSKGNNWIEENWFKLALVIGGIFVALLIFMIFQNQTISELSQQLAGTKTIIENVTRAR